MTERFNAGADQTIYGASGVGPAETPSSLTALGVGQGSGQSANAQERNSMIGFEFPIRWDDISSNLSRLDQKKYLDDLVDDMTIRDRELEDFLNTNIVNGIVAGSNITIDRASGVVTITGAAPAWTPFTPTIVGAAGAGTVSNNNSSYVRVGSIVHVRINCTVFFSPSSYPTRIDDLPVAVKAANAAADYSTGMGDHGGFFAHYMRNSGTPNTRLSFTYPSQTVGNLNNWDIGSTITYEAA